MYMFDLEVPSDFTPVPSDGEVESFTPFRPVTSCVPFPQIAA